MANPKLISVSFINAESGECFAQSNMPIEQLPASFEARTTLNLSGQDWEVVSADPMTRAEIDARGQLRLTLQKIKIGNVSLRELLYSLPTICDAIPGIAPGTTKLHKRTLELHEDDWRQIELISWTRRDEIDVDLDEIYRIYQEERTPEGFFKKIHVRKAVANPLDECTLSLLEVRRQLPSLSQLDGVAYRDVAGLVEGGFAFRTESGLRIYGLERNNAIAVLGLDTEGNSACPDNEVSGLAALMQAHNLCLVDWCRVAQVQGSQKELAEYLQGQVS